MAWSVVQLSVGRAALERPRVALSPNFHLNFVTRSTTVMPAVYESSRSREEGRSGAGGWGELELSRRGVVWVDGGSHSQMVLRPSAPITATRTSPPAGVSTAQRLILTFGMCASRNLAQAKPLTWMRVGGG